MQASREEANERIRAGAAMRAAKKEDGGGDDTCGGQRDRHKRRHGYHSLLVVGGSYVRPPASRHRIPDPHLPPLGRKARYIFPV